MRKLLPISLVLFLSSSLFAALGSFNSSETTYISDFSSNGGSNFDSSTILLVDEGDSTRSLIGFSNLVGGGAGQVPMGAVISNATLSIKTATNPTANSLGIHQVLSTWNPSTVTWNNFGASPGGVAGTDFAAAAADSVVTSAANTQYNWNVTSIVQAWANGQANLGFALVGGLGPSVSDGATFFSDAASGSMGPSLTVEYAAVPEPSSFLLMGLVAGSAYGYRRFRNRKTVEDNKEE